MLADERTARNTASLTGRSLRARGYDNIGRDARSRGYPARRPVKIHERWVEDVNSTTPGFIGGTPCKETNWVVMAVEVARRGNLRKWTSPLCKKGSSLLSPSEELMMQSPASSDSEILSKLAATETQSVVMAMGEGDETLARGLMHRLLKQIDRLHAHGVLHLDLKPDNITMNELWEICIIDFGHARPITDPSLPTLTAYGSPGSVRRTTLGPARSRTCFPWHGDVLHAH